MKNKNTNTKKQAISKQMKTVKLNIDFLIKRYRKERSRIFIVKSEIPMKLLVPFVNKLDI